MARIMERIGSPVASGAGIAAQERTGNDIDTLPGDAL
jgi:hypothetical protein